MHLRVVEKSRKRKDKKKKHKKDKKKRKKGFLLVNICAFWDHWSFVCRCCCFSMPSILDLRQFIFSQ